jgi:hypothetical protein
MEIMCYYTMVQYNSVHAIARVHVLNRGSVCTHSRVYSLDPPDFPIQVVSRSDRNCHINSAKNDPRDLKQARKTRLSIFYNLQ